MTIRLTCKLRNRINAAGMIECLLVPPTETFAAVKRDFIVSSCKEIPAFMKAAKPGKDGTRQARQVNPTSRQSRHLVKEA